jgi:hypothetical protein
MDDPIIDLQSDYYFMGEALRREALAHRPNGLLTVQTASGIVTA